MFDTSRALADMANQIRASRAADGLTLQQLANRSGVAASTIHKIEARQMVPTVTVLLKIAKGLGCRPEKLVRDRYDETERQADSAVEASPRAPESPPVPALPSRNVGVWQVDVDQESRLPTLDLAPRQRAIVLVERGGLDLHAGEERVRMGAGDCIELEGGRIQHAAGDAASASLTLIVSPAGNLDMHLGQPRASSPAYA